MLFSHVGFSLLGNNYLTIVSLILLFSALYLYKKLSNTIIDTGLVFIMTLTYTILIVTYEVADYFTGEGINEATIYHIRYGLYGAGFSEYRILIIFTIGFLVLSIIFLVRFIRNKERCKNNRVSTILLSHNSLVLFLLLLGSLVLNPASVDLYNLQKNSIVFNKEHEDETVSDFYNYYRKPYIKKTASISKNLVFIYAESLERTYFNEFIFPGLIKYLRRIESRSIYFTNIRQLPGTGWTIAGITASQCGIPLFTPSHGNSMSGMDQFLPLAVCLGDLLSDEGYKLVYMGGASLSFAGKGKFFKTHGFGEVLGREELLPVLGDPEYHSGWGLYDDSLFDLAYRRFVKLSKSNKKFGLFMLTLDTHHPNGNPSRTCRNIKYKDGSNPILNAVACSDYLISNFIERIIKSPYAKKTIIVLMSDHLAMRNTAYDLLRKAKRTDLFMIIDPYMDHPMEIDTIGSTLDISPTLLPFLGFAGEIGLGRNLLSKKSKIKERLFIHRNLNKWRRSIIKFWNFPKIKKKLEINIQKRYVQIDSRKFKIPVLIELNNKLETTLKFQFYCNKTLNYYRRKLSQNKYFILIEECRAARVFDKFLGLEGFCLLAGKGKRYTMITKINNNVTYTAEEVRKLLHITRKYEKNKLFFEY